MTGTAPVAQTISVSANNASTVSSTVVILGYGCIYQGGYVYAIDDTTATSSSVRGKVAATSDQTSPFAPGIIWSSDGSGGTSNIAIYGISETSTSSSPNPSSAQVSGQIACNGNTDGACDSNNVYVYYQNNATGAPINTSLYAIGLCKATINGYSDWYLPAICEGGYGSSADCGTLGSPALQNMQSNLVDNNVGSLDGYYWTSTESAVTPSSEAWLQLFQSGGGTNQLPFTKGFIPGVRCSRAVPS